MTATATTATGRLAGAALAFAGVVVGHLALASARDVVAEGVAPMHALWRLSGELGAFVPVALALGAIAAWLTGRGALTAVVAWLLLAFGVGGAGVRTGALVPESLDGRWIAALAGGAAAGGLMLLGVLAVTRARTSRMGAAGAGALVLVALAIGFGLRFVVPAPTMVVREVARALLEDEGAWRVVSANERLAPEPGTITPVIDWRARGGDRAALVIAPGGEVELEVRPEDGPVRLLTSVGVDMGNAPRLRAAWDALDFRFEVLVDGELRFDETLRLGRRMERFENQWHPVTEDGVDGLALVPGNVVRLRTSVTSTSGGPDPSEMPWRIGFSDLVLERRREWARTRSSPDEPNVLLVLMDTQRRDRLGCYGYERDVSPEVDRLAARGTLYEAAYASSAWTWPSTASVLTGLRPEAHGVLDGDSCFLARSLDALAEVMQRAGLTTAAFSGSPLIVPSNNFDQGFETFDGSKKGFRKSNLIVPRAIEWMETRAGERFFLYLHLVDPHDPHRPDPEALERFAPQGPPAGMPESAFNDYTWALRRGEARSRDGDWDTTRVAPEEHQEWLSDLYDACVWTGDRWVGEVLDALERLGLEDETVVAFTADHGEEFFEHGMLEHGHALFDEVVGVPLILAGPGVPVGARSSVPVSNRHLAPTLARAAGLDLDAVTDAVDLRRPEGLEAPPVLFGTHHGFWKGWHRTVLQGLRDGDRVLHWAPQAGDWWESEPTPGGELRLLDPTGTRDLTDAEPERVASMREELERILREAALQRVAPSFGGGDTTREMLESIGYLESSDDDE